MDEAVSQRLQAVESLAQAIMQRLGQEVEQLGFEKVTLQSLDLAQFHLDKDPANGLFSLVGQWRNPRGDVQGCLLFHADGSFFVEQDIALPHPSKKRWFVEAVNAWGKGDEIKAEPRLLPMPE